MELKEFMHALSAVLIFTVVGSFAFITQGKWGLVPAVFLFATIIIFTAIFSKKLMAYLLDCGIEHETWKFSQWGFNPGHHFKKDVPWGVILPLFISLFTWGFVKFGAILSYEARALKKRAAKRFGVFSFSELTEWHNGVIGAAGIVSMFILVIIIYFLPWNLEYFAKLAVFYAFSNLLPLPKLDGLQIFFGSKVLYTVLAVITLILTVYAFAL